MGRYWAPGENVTTLDDFGLQMVVYVPENVIQGVQSRLEVTETSPGSGYGWTNTGRAVAVDPEEI